MFGPWAFEPVSANHAVGLPTPVARIMSTPTLKGTILVVMGLSHGQRFAVAGHIKLSILFFLCFCVFSAHFEPVVMRLGPWKIPKCLENWPFWDQKWVKNGSKTGQKRNFSKSDPAPFGMLKQVFLAHFEPVVTRFGPWKVPKCLENWPFWDQKWVKYWSKTLFSKSHRGLFGVHKQVVLEHKMRSFGRAPPDLVPPAPGRHR